MVTCCDFGFCMPDRILTEATPRISRASRHSLAVHHGIAFRQRIRQGLAGRNNL